MKLAKLGFLLAVRGRYEGGVRENKKHEVNKIRWCCLAVRTTHVFVYGRGTARRKHT